MNLHQEALDFCKRHQSLDVALVEKAMYHATFLCLDETRVKLAKALEDLRKDREEKNRQH